MQIRNGQGQKFQLQLPNIKQFQPHLPQVKQTQRKLIAKKMKPIPQLPILLKSPIGLQKDKSKDLEIDQNSLKIKLIGESLVLKTQLNYQDDEKLEEITKQSRVSTLDEKLKFEITSLYDAQQLNANQESLMPAMVSVQVDEDALKQQIGVDLICLIDRSGSMVGDKIRTAQQSLIKLLDFLKDKDRLCIIEFNEYATRLTPLLRVTKERKQYFKRIIRHISADGGTTISSGMEIALNQINQRKYVNQITSIFILSDGQDERATYEVSQLLHFFKQSVIIHTFGFGSDHDADMMSSLSNLGSGSFYFVHNISLLDEFFVDALGGLVSAVAEDITIKAISYPDFPLDDICIYKTYGNMWKESNQNRRYEINLKSISAGKRKDFVFEIYFPDFQQVILEQQRTQKIIEARIWFTDIITKQKIVKSAELKIKLYNQNEQITPQLIENTNVATQYYRVKAADMMEYAKQLCKHNQYQKAQYAIGSTISRILQNPQVAAQSQNLLMDLYQSMQAASEYNYQSYGSQQLTQLSSNYYSQEGLSSNFENGQQTQSLLSKTNTNKVQTEMLTIVQQGKSSLRRN